MKLSEITNQSRKVINKMEALYITYATYGSIQIYQELYNLVSENENSLDTDIKMQAILYKHKLHNDLLKILSLK